MDDFDVKDTNWHDFCYIKGENKKDKLLNVNK